MKRLLILTVDLASHIDHGCPIKSLQWNSCHIANNNVAHNVSLNEEAYYSDCGCGKSHRSSLSEEEVSAELPT